MILCHPELVSGSHIFSNKKITYPSYCANEVRCGIFYFLLHHSFSFLRRKEKERLQEKETRKSKTTTKFNQKRVNSFHSNSTRFAVVSLSGCKWFYVTLNSFQGLIIFPIKHLPFRHTAQTKCVAVSFYYFNSKIHSGWSFVCVRGCIDAP